MCPLAVLPVPLTIPAVPQDGSVRSSKYTRVNLLISVLLHSYHGAGGTGLDGGGWTLHTPNLVGAKCQEGSEAIWSPSPIQPVVGKQALLHTLCM